MHRKPQVRIVGLREHRSEIEVARNLLRNFGAESSDFLECEPRRDAEDPLSWAPQLDADAIHLADALLVLYSPAFLVSPFTMAELAYSRGERRQLTKRSQFRRAPSTTDEQVALFAQEIPTWMPVVLVDVNELKCESGRGRLLELLRATVSEEPEEARAHRLKAVVAPFPTLPPFLMCLAGLIVEKWPHVVDCLSIPKIRTCLLGLGRRAQQAERWLNDDLASRPESDVLAEIQFAAVRFRILQPAGRVLKISEEARNWAAMQFQRTRFRSWANETGGVALSLDEQIPKVIAGQPSTLQRLVWSEGGAGGRAIWIGECRHGKPTGIGRIEWEEGTMFFGSVGTVNGVEEVQCGVYLHSDGSTSEGTFAKNQRWDVRVYERTGNLCGVWKGGSKVWPLPHRSWRA
jgi:hypothetical protein